MTPVLYSFRRCPYAMRARMALGVASVTVELREVVLRDKPAAFLEASPSKTVPCLVLPDRVLDESFDIMVWALGQQDPEGWLDMPEDGFRWVERADGPFKDALDRTKYANRYPGVNADAQRDIASDFLEELDQQIDQWIFAKATLADFAILPFVRQFAFIDKDWFDAQPWPNLQAWLVRFIKSSAFESMMHKYSQWHEGDAPVYFPDFR